MDFGEVIYQIDDGVATITLNRPHKMNATTEVTDQELQSAVEKAGADPTVRAIIITGAGRGFCVGADMTRLQQLQEEPNNLADDALEPDPVEDRYNIERNYQHHLTYMLRVPKPIFAAINGAAAGSGVSIALFCDYRYMAEGAKLTTVFAKRGLIAEHGQSWMLPRLVGLMNAMDLLFSGRAVGAGEAAEMGLVRALPAEGFLTAVQKAARELVRESSPRSIAVMKRQIYDDMFRDLNAAVLAMEIEAHAAFASEDFKEGVASFLEKRPPAFSGS